MATRVVLTLPLFCQTLPWDIDGNGSADGLIFAGAESTTCGLLRAVINGGLRFVTDPAIRGFAARLPESFSMTAGVAVADWNMGCEPLTECFETEYEPASRLMTDRTWLPRAEGKATRFGCRGLGDPSIAVWSPRSYSRS